MRRVENCFHLLKYTWKQLFCTDPNCGEKKKTKARKEEASIAIWKWVDGCIERVLVGLKAKEQVHITTALEKVKKDVPLTMPCIIASLKFREMETD